MNVSPSTRTRPFALLTLLGAVAVGASACLNDDITGARPLSMALTASVTAGATGDSVVFEYAASGTGLLNVHLHYGDGSADTTRFSGGFEEPDSVNLNRYDTVWYRQPVGAEGWVKHAFDSTGTFVVIGYAVAAAGVAADTVVVTIN